MTVYAIEDSNGNVQSVGYESRRDAVADQRDCFPGGRVQEFLDAQDLRAEYPDASWLDRHSDEELEEVPA